MVELTTIKGSLIFSFEGQYTKITDSSIFTKYTITLTFYQTKLSLKNDNLA